MAKIGSEASKSFIPSEILKSVIPAPRRENYTVSVDAVNLILEAGTFMEIVASKLVIWNGAGVPAGVLAERVDVSLTESIATVYTFGLFDAVQLATINGANYASFVTAVNGNTNAVHGTVSFDIA